MCYIVPLKKQCFFIYKKGELAKNMENNSVFTFIKLENGNVPQTSKEGLKIARISSTISPFTFIKLFNVADNNINPRVAKENGITQDIRATLATYPECFGLMSKGIVIASQNCRKSDRGRIGLTFNEDPTREGIMDGGHNALAIAQYILQQIYPDQKIIKEWAECKNFWKDHFEEIIDKFNEHGGNEAFPFSIPIEVIFPTDEDGAFEDYLKYINLICEARNTNVQLKDSTKDNQVGIYDLLKEQLSCRENVVWKTGMHGKIKVEDVVSITSLLFVYLQEKELLPANLNTLNPVSIYSSKSRCVDFFGDVIRHPEISDKNGDKYVIKNSLIKSAIGLADDLIKFYDKMYLKFPSIYQRNPGKFGGIKAVDNKRVSTSPFGSFDETIEYKYPAAFFIPLFCGVRELITYNENTNTVSWIINPTTINYDDLDCEKYVEMIKFLNFNPQNVGKAAMMYREGVDTFNAYKRTILSW